MANIGKRQRCLCIKTMDLIIKKNKRDLFTKDKEYDCVIMNDGLKATYYKVYGEEFDLSCTDEEFKKHFILKE